MNIGGYTYVDRAYRSLFDTLTDAQKERYKRTAPSKQVTRDKAQSLPYSANPVGTPSSSSTLISHAGLSFAYSSCPSASFSS